MVTVNAVHKVECFQHLDKLNRYLRMMDSSPAEHYPDPEVRAAAECFLRNSIHGLEELLFGETKIATGEGDYRDVHLEKEVLYIVPISADKSKGVDENVVSH